MVHCPYCGSINVQRIGLYTYQCMEEGDVFDIHQCRKEDIDEFDDYDDCDDEYDDEEDDL